MTLAIDPAFVARTAVEISAGLLVGLIVGTVYFGMLWRSTRALTGEGTILRAIMLQFARLALAAVALTLVARYGGAFALLAAAAAIIAARELVLRRAGARS